jgi:methionyl-tRNA formyltransferase
MENKKIVLLASDGDSTNIVYHALAEGFNIGTVIIEGKESKKIFLQRRIKKLGFIKVIGQVVFQMLVVKLLSRFSSARIQKILAENKLDVAAIDEKKIVRVNSVNDEQVKELLRSLSPDVVVVNGTRIISKKILSSVNCPFINMHAGITPMYRGVHGGYWALVNKDEAHCGVTVHLVDPGIDTGNILYQDIIAPTAKDNFITYPYLQTSAGVRLLNKAVEDAVSNNIRPVAAAAGASRLWYHPTIWQYIYHRIFKKVK